MLNEALIKKDQKILNDLLDSDLSYGHSNGWIESKSELLKNNSEGILIYKSISVDTSTIWTQVNHRLAFVRYTMHVEVNLRGKDIGLKMHVGQVWKRKGRQWKLLFRQSAKLA
ncbi:MAG: nuclear transport factor 2 family protein [Saprospiraceae bacterium]|nr:nuclear transport factor 2 family protein [Saprospiraceae bacterium]MBK7812689.1 nuclear transport factor 2 family protein [Saprospiraceae bacterium]MBK9630880.1 nuclear transport factor 2 family protein [Saprospiraceae bacterium]